MANETEYQTLTKRQEAIKEDMLGVAAAIQKIDEGGAKAIISAIQNFALTAANIPLTIPKDFAYALAGPVGLFFSIRDRNKLKKYYARIAELETEYNKNAERIAQLSLSVSKEKLSVMAEEEARNANTATNQNYLAIGGLGLVAAVAFIRRSNK